MSLRYLFILLILNACFCTAMADLDSNVDSYYEEVDQALTEILTTNTGCEIVEKFFLLRSDPIQYYFGVSKKAAGKIIQICPGNNVPNFSFIYKLEDLSRPAKKYSLTLQTQLTGFSGWTEISNVTHIIMPYLDRKELRKILTHELIIMMDDKFSIQTSDFSKLSFNFTAPESYKCIIDRFLGNPYYQILLSSLRAFRLELRFAKEFGDTEWVDQLKATVFIENNPVDNFLNLKSILDPYQVSVLRFFMIYKDNCQANPNLDIQTLSNADLNNLIERDWSEFKLLFKQEHLQTILEFLTEQIVISNSKSNQINFGPRPAIGTSGWSKTNPFSTNTNLKALTAPSGSQLKIPEKLPMNEQFLPWANQRRNNFEKKSNQYQPHTPVPLPSSQDMSSK